MKQHRIYLFITIFIFCTCFVVFLETHTFYDGLTDTTDTHFERSEVCLLDTSGLNPLIPASSTVTSDLEHMITESSHFIFTLVIILKIAVLMESTVTRHCFLNIRDIS